MTTLETRLKQMLYEDSLAVFADMHTVPKPPPPIPELSKEMMEGMDDMGDIHE